MKQQWYLETIQKTLMGWRLSMFADKIWAPPSKDWQILGSPSKD